LTLQSTKLIIVIVKKTNTRKRYNMKVKSLLKTFEGIDYHLITENGSQLEHGYVPTWGYDGTSNYEDYKVVKITTVSGCDELFITIK
jgi:hypothetical protein